MDLQKGMDWGGSFEFEAYHAPRVDPVYTFVKSDPQANFKWGVRRDTGPEISTEDRDQDHFSLFVNDLIFVIHLSLFPCYTKY